MKQQAIISIVVASLVLVGCSPKEESTTDDRTIQQIQAENGIPVTVQPVVQGSIRHIEQSNGTLQGQQETVLANGVGGTLGRIHVEVGQQVRNGSTVATMIFDAGSPVVVAQANFDYAEQMYERVQALYEEGAVALEQVEGANTQYEAARNQLGQARTLVSITSPFSGTVLEIFQTQGSKIGAETPIVKVANLDRMKVDMMVNDQAIDLYQVGQTVFLEVGQDTIWGEIQRKALSANAMNHSFKVTAIFDNDDSRLSPGMFKNINTIVDQKDMIIKVPFEIISFEGEQTFVYIAENDIAVKTEVTLGVRNGTEYEIVSGLTVVDKIITSGITQISDGSKINIVNL